MEPLFKFSPEKTKEQRRRDVMKVGIISAGAIIVFGVFGGLSHLAEKPLDVAADATASPTTAVFDQCGNISAGLERQFTFAQKALSNIADGATGGADKIVLQKAANEVEKIQSTKTMQKCRDAESENAATLDAGIKAVIDAAAGATKANARTFLDPIIEAAALR
jgi:hypothetical protein